MTTTTLQARSVEDAQAHVRAYAEARMQAGLRAESDVRARADLGDAYRPTPPPGREAATMAAAEAATFLRPIAGRSKSALSGSASLSASDADCVLLDVSGLAGVVDYQPAECTFTAYAGTRIADIEAMLAAHGQYLPFEPPFADRGATIGGTVATGVSGPARLRYGGVRDFVLGVRFVDGTGRVVRGGGRVVKNAAGFYLQHLLLGSLGTLGVLTEVTCKVFPRAQAQTTLEASYPTLAAAIEALARLRRSAFELESAELVPPGRLLLRVGGSPNALAARVNNLSGWLRDSSASVRPIDDDAEERRCWQEARELTWAPSSFPLVKVATTLGRIAKLDQRVAGVAPARRYGAGGEVAWIAWPRPLAELDTLLRELELPGLVVLAEQREQPAQPADVGPLLGVQPDAAFLARVRRTLDPHGVFGFGLRHD